MEYGIESMWTAIVTTSFNKTLRRSANLTLWPIVQSIDREVRGTQPTITEVNVFPKSHCTGSWKCHVSRFPLHYYLLCVMWLCVVREAWAWTVNCTVLSIEFENCELRTETENWKVKRLQATSFELRITNTTLCILCMDYELDFKRLELETGDNIFLDY